MKVYFNKLKNGDWICYDSENTTGDLFVDPAKIKLLQDKLPGCLYDTAINNSINQVIDFPMSVDIQYFGQIQVHCELWFHNNNICNLKFVNELDPTEEPIGEFPNKFVLELDSLPAFDPYPYPVDENPTLAKNTNELRKRYPGLAGRSDGWLRKILANNAPKDRDYLNAWTTKDITMYVYDFHFDDKYHWIVKHPDGRDEVMCPELWTRFFRREAMEDGLWYLGTEAVDPIYGSMRLCIEVTWHDGMPKHVSLCAPDGDPIKRGLQRFQIQRTEPI